MSSVLHKTYVFFRHSWWEILRNLQDQLKEWKRTDRFLQTMQPQQEHAINLVTFSSDYPVDILYFVHGRDLLRSFNMTYKMKELMAFCGYYSPEEKIRSFKRPGDSYVSLINLLARLSLHSTQLLILRSRQLQWFHWKVSLVLCIISTKMEVFE